jgi:hypothetical protein
MGESFLSRLHRILAGDAIQCSIVLRHDIAGVGLCLAGYPLFSIFVRLLHCHIWTELIPAG